MPPGSVEVTGLPSVPQLNMDLLQATGAAAGKQRDPQTNAVRDKR